MPLYGGGNKNKAKGTRRGAGNAQKAGVKGVAAQYVTRNKAIKKLQISLKDFRRLCILKGIYPRDPRKKKEGKDKTYYHVKDIAFLAHEPLLHKFRELKTFLKKYTKALNRRDWSKLDVLEEHRPQFTLAHLIKERYPTFQDALRDLDDPLSLVALFATLPASITPSANQHTSDKQFDCERLSAEWARMVVHTHALRKVFVSIKGIYYQARVQGADITWLVPHAFNQRTPDDVDYRVMLTFLQFYAEMLRFVNLKLYHDAGLVYPPVLDQAAYEQRAGLDAVQMLPKGQTVAGEVKDESASAGAKAKGKKGGVDGATKKALQKSVAAVVQKLQSSAKDESAAMDVDADESAAKSEEQEESADDFAALRGEEAAGKTPEEQDAIYASSVFRGLRFLLGREVPTDSLMFVIRCGGGEVASERDLKPEEAASSRFTHQIVDRPAVAGEKLSTREYVQPQWVYDSFNSYNCVPVAPYAPGVVPPPHLSPFVKEEEDSYLMSLPEAARDTVYIPKQRAVLQGWGAKASWLRRVLPAGEGEVPGDAADSSAVARAGASAGMSPEEAEEAERAAEEARHQADLARERAGTSHSAHEEQVEAKKAAQAEARKASKKNKQQEDEDEAEEADEDEDEEAADEDESEGERDVVPDSEDEAEEEEEAPAAPASSRKRKAAASVDPNAPSELAKAMMPKKDKRLYSRMMYGIEKKKEAVEKLEQKREAIEKQQNKKQKTTNKKK